MIEKLKEIVGEENILTENLEEYSEDLTENEASVPLAVVKPGTVEEVIRIVKLANENSVPLVPALARTNVAGLCIPPKGGVVVDLLRMKKILEFSKDEMYLVIEPGVTFQDVREFLDGTGFDIGYPLSPPYATVVGNFLLDGLVNLSLKYGSTSRWINGLEVVLPTGELVRIGTCAVAKSWFSRAPLPDITGLFINWQGTTGIVTKMGIQVWPKPRLRKRFFFIFSKTETCLKSFRELAKTGFYDDMGALSWATAKRFFGAWKPVQKDPAEPEFLLYLDISANIKEEFKIKVNFTRKTVREILGSLDIDNLLKFAPELKKFAEFPMTLDFLLEHGLSWVGAYGPMCKLEEAVKCGMKIMQEEGFPPVVVIRPMLQGHFTVARFIESFNKDNEKEEVRKLNLRILRTILDLGYVPYKAPKWAVEELKRRDETGFFKLVERMRKFLDPKGIMNPERL